jgi:8-oxo-dGTP diphosphatase
MKEAKAKTRATVLAAGGIVLRNDSKPEIAVVQLRKMGAWVLPKGKLAAGESAIAAARREVLEETGHRVSIHEFLGTLAYEAGGRQKIVQFWRMQALGAPVGELMRDVKAMEWLALDAAIERLTHAREQIFLAQVGPVAIRRAVQPQRKSMLRRHRRAPAPQPQTPALPELIAPVDFAAPLPPDSLALARVASLPLESRATERPVASRDLRERTLRGETLFGNTLIEKTWDWLRQTTLPAKPRRE